MPLTAWRLPSPLPTRDDGEEHLLDLPPELWAVMARRGLADPAALASLLDPPEPPDPFSHFPDLEKAVARLAQAAQLGEDVAICGDYDADGMTSTALLTGLLERLGGHPQPAIPSRQEEGYGLNRSMVERLAAEGISLLITVDNGVSAHEALERAATLGLDVILTDHHTLPEVPPRCLALLHPSVTPSGSPYRGLAGVGLAYVLAMALAQRMASQEGLEVALELFCIGTIADMAPLHGVNRRWLRQGLPRLSRPRLAGLRALIQLAGLEDAPVDAEAVGFQLAPRINAVGRLGDPLLVVELLTTRDRDRALELARQCDALNRERRELCQALEAEALALLESDGPRCPAFVVLAQSHWHHGVIGIVAARLVERLGRPVALLGGEGNGRLRASVRAPRGFAVDQALAACAPLLERFGGHAAAGGFTVAATNLAELQERLEDLAEVWLAGHPEGVMVEPEALLRLERIDGAFWQALQKLGPFGVAHPMPVFWSVGCRVEQQKILRGGHLQLTLSQGEAKIQAMAWRWEGAETIPALVDVAYRLRQDAWQGRQRLLVDLLALRPSPQGEEGVVLLRGDRPYRCVLREQELVISNAAGQEICSPLMWEGSQAHPQINGEHPYVRALLLEAVMALGLGG
ncbi:MAG: single-stranded-DNA-specific exonuclease RecJ [Cyanobacteriota bacterium]|nr:single-stranded-DNA-specific exonuclease RecJ [Cyanobacteriota bacterium]